ncbi:GNAT family N-acetyltransferase [Methylocaldum sp.]|uniref:GNAT family N-acetyltransferase n=1 Tax=Methylocaldum sp. TaxID=1969727 RepID=UPI002D7034D3|nr:GNAT family N-acetyltransferase [Methylocaldum sp.]HYE34727.1 GNAT family N-acetyltransferase [Methylocaldum sp.]
MLSIVSAEPADAEAIAEMALDIWQRHYYPEVLTQDAIEYFWNRMYRPEVVRSEMACGVVYERIELDGRMIGFLAYHHQPEQSRVRLNKLYLLPEYHEQGFGAFALAHVKAVAARLGAREIFLYVFRKNDRAVRAYFRAGFVIARAETTECGDGYYYDDYVMCWTLDRTG